MINYGVLLLKNKFKEVYFGFIPNHWELDSMQNLSELVTDYVANGSFASLKENVKYNDFEDYAVLIRLADFNNNFQGNFVYISEDSYEFLSKTKLFGDEIIISNVGANLGTVFKCPFLKYKMSLGPNSILVKMKGIDDFYYYWFKSIYGQFMLDTIVSGSAQPKFNKTDFRNILVPVPPINEQIVISRTLKEIDNTINITEKINENLINLTKVIYKSWFENFTALENCEFIDSEIGKIPKDWHVVELSSFIKIYNGYSYTSDELEESTCAMATIKNFNRNGGFKSNGFKEIVYSEKIKDHHFLKKNDVLVSCTDVTQEAEIIANSVLLLSKLDYEEIIMSMDLVKVESTIPEINNFLLNSILDSYRFKMFSLGYVNGTTVLHLDKNVFNDFKIALPYDLSILKGINDSLESIFTQISYNFEKIQKLSELRNYILPKLMSGEIDVSEINCNLD